MKKFLAIVLAGLFSTSAFALDTCYTGSYYEPATSGEGIALQVSEDTAVLYFYAYHQNQPNYFVGVADNDSDVLAFPAYQTSRDAETGEITSYEVGEFLLTPADEGNFTFTWDFDVDLSKLNDPDITIPWCLNDSCSGSKELVSLLRPVSCE